VPSGVRLLIVVPVAVIQAAIMSPRGQTPRDSLIGSQARRIERGKELLLIDRVDREGRRLFPTGRFGLTQDPRHQRLHAHSFVPDSFHPRSGSIDVPCTNEPDRTMIFKIADF